MVMLSYFSHIYAQSNSQIEAQARWHINYGHYLIEVGKYLEALEYFDTAFDLSSTSATITDALSAKANLLALYLKAQAIAARTYALYQIEHRKTWSYDMVDNEGDQVYGGVNREHSKCTQAVNATKGILLSKNKRPILAMYSANSGGFTASAKAIFNLPNKSYLIAQEDLYSLKGKMAYWKRTYTARQIETALEKKGIYVKGIKNIRASSFGPSGRVLRVKIDDRNDVRIFRTRTTLKRALKLPEILFKIKKSGDTYIFNGNGYGHGVGYSQWGGAIMGESYKYADILEFYYPGCKLITVW